MRSRKFLFAAIIIGLLSLCLQGEIQAQMQGHTGKGAWGLQSGSQMQEGFLIAPVWVNFGADKIMNKDGEEIPNISGADRKLSVNALALFGWWVSPYKIFGANYGVMTNLSMAESSVELASLEFNNKFAFGDLYLQPVNLGWHYERFDITASYGIYFPTGKYEADASYNTGKGMWSHELGAGATAYFDAAKNWHLSALAYFEMHSKKKDTDIKVGNILTVQGGLGRSFYDGALKVGAVYYMQWKVSPDKIGIDSDIPLLPDEITLDNKHRVYGLGPEVTVPIAKNDRLYALITARYHWELGARSNLQGNVFNLFVQIPFFSETK